MHPGIIAIASTDSKHKPHVTRRSPAARGLILLECLSGSRAYGTDTPESDTDIRGIFIAPREQFYGLEHPAQISDETNDTTYYEIGRFIELLTKNNPNILELIFTRGDSVLQRSRTTRSPLPRRTTSRSSANRPSPATPSPRSARRAD